MLMTSSILAFHRVHAARQLFDRHVAYAVDLAYVDQQIA
jgi:hypothetical protein